MQKAAKALSQARVPPSGAGPKGVTSFGCVGGSSTSVSEERGLSRVEVGGDIVDCLRESWCWEFYVMEAAEKHSVHSVESL